MTGRDLIIYIIENHLEDVDLFKDDMLPGLMTCEEAAEKFEVGTATIRAWAACGILKYVMIKGTVYIPANAEITVEGGNNEQKNARSKR